MSCISFAFCSDVAAQKVKIAWEMPGKNTCDGAQRGFTCCHGNPEMFVTCLISGSGTHSAMADASLDLVLTFLY